MAVETQTNAIGTLKAFPKRSTGEKSYLTYGWCDAAIISQSGLKLEDSGHFVFLDKWDLSSGQMVWNTIDEHIDDAEKSILFLSRDAMTGKGV